MHYTMKFDSGNINWMDDRDAILMFLRQQQLYFEHYLKRGRVVTLAEVLEALGENPIPSWTSIFGWQNPGNDKIEFKIDAPIIFSRDSDFKIGFSVDYLFGGGLNLEWGKEVPIVEYKKGEKRMDFLLEDEISGRRILAENAKNITDYLRHLEKDFNDRLTAVKVVSLNHFYDLVELPRIPYGDDVGWVFNPWIRVRISASSMNLCNGSLPTFALHFDPEPEPWGAVANPYNVSIPRRNGKTLCAEAIKHIFAEYGLENRKENNMASKSDIPCILIGKKGDPRGIHTVELKIKNVIFNDPATIVFWSDGTKTVVKAGANDIFDPEKGLAMAISKKVLGNNYKAYGRFKKWLPKEYKEPKSSDGGLEGLTKAVDNLRKTAKEAFEIATSEK